MKNIRSLSNHRGNNTIDAELEKPVEFFFGIIQRSSKLTVAVFYQKFKRKIERVLVRRMSFVGDNPDSAIEANKMWDRAMERPSASFSNDLAL
jgi:hypothetical protein